MRKAREEVTLIDVRNWRFHFAAIKEEDMTGGDFMILSCLDTIENLRYQLSDLAEFATTQSDNLKFKDAAIIDLNNTNHALRTQLDDLEAENARLREDAAWVSVEDRLPEDGQFVLAIENGGKYYALFSGGWFWDTITHMPVDPTVWREFPSLSYSKM